MKTFLLIVAVIHLVSFSSKADEYDELIKIEKIILSVKEPHTLKEFLRDLRILASWNEKEDGEMLINVETGFNSVGRKYKMPNESPIEDVFFAGQADKGSPSPLVDYKVTRIILGIRGDCHVFQWEDGVFVKVRIFEKPEKNEKNEE